MPTKTKPLSEQVIVVTGASSGIGRATALQFARQGARVVAAARSEEALDTLVSEIQGAGGDALAVPTDVAQWPQVQALAQAAVEHYGGIDTWVNAAAVHLYGRAEDITVEEFSRVVQINLMGQVHGAYAALPYLRRSGGGVLIGVSSVEGVRAVPLQAPYVTSKWALRGFYDVLRMELMADKAPVAVTTILPASIDTPLFAHARSKLEALPKPPPPVYAPEAVARAIVKAATHPTREVPVGGSALQFILSQRFAPALTDRLMAVRRIGFASQVTDQSDTGSDNLEQPLPGPGAVHGELNGHAFQRSRYTEWLGHHPALQRSALAAGLTATAAVPVAAYVTGRVRRPSWQTQAARQAATLVRQGRRWAGRRWSGNRLVRS
ncbi:SDR family oxidoreductase [Streptomyces sp. NPDC006265]|uniref:SDR family oxidoreductase n=1 Tax=Streptomyces sp. NPDC006265 TaxID=3156740 RepID=UPI00339DC94F